MSERARSAEETPALVRYDNPDFRSSVAVATRQLFSLAVGFADVQKDKGPSVASLFFRGERGQTFGNSLTKKVVAVDLRF